MGEEPGGRVDAKKRGRRRGDRAEGRAGALLFGGGGGGAAGSGESAAPLAFAYEPHRFVEFAVGTFGGVAFDAVDHEGRGIERSLVGVVAPVLRGDHLVIEGLEGGARVEAGLHAGAELFEGKSAERLLGAQGLPRGEDLIDAVEALLGIVGHGRSSLVCVSAHYVRCSLIETGRDETQAQGA